MAKNNSEFLQTVPTNIGEITYIQTIRQNVPAGLRKPYEYIASMSKANELFAKINKYLKPKEAEGFQCAGTWKKPISYGFRLNLFLLGYSKSFGENGGTSADGVTKEQWDSTCQHVQSLLFQYLGSDAKCYIDDYDEKNKFQMRFETYIMYKELAKK